MKFKYYLRGAGIGIIVSTVILSAASLFQDNMSDAEIIRRAMELGMIMEEGTGGTLADIPGQGNTGMKPNTNTVSDDGQSGEDNGQLDTTNDGQGAENTGDISNTDDTDDQATQPETSSEDGKNTDKEANQQDEGQTEPDESSTSQEKDKKKKKEGEKITIKIEGGDVSRAVSQKVYDAGLVEDAERFNDYLGEHGYDNLLQPGTYHIKKGASFQQIAEMFTSK